MKIYSTIRSDKASKSQGGNKRLSIVVTVGEPPEDQEILLAQVECEETETANIYRLWNGDIQADRIIIPKKGYASCPNCESNQKEKDIDYLGDSKYSCPNCINTKGKKEKGEKVKNPCGHELCSPDICGQNIPF
jgi:hypothetical protein